jgi:glycosyltransferase involved in cell wall biosynthesis
VATPRILNLMLAPAAGGLESMALNYHRVLEAHGAQVLSVGITGSWFEQALADHPGGFAGLKPASPIDPRQGWALARIAKAFAPDVVLAHGSRGAALAVAALSRQPARIAAVVHNFRARRAITRTALAICVSPAVGADVRARFPAVSVAVVENFAPLSRTPPRAVVANPPHIGTLGRLHEEKGFDILLDAAAQLRDRGRDFRLSVAGDGPAAADLKAQTARLGLTAQVDFPGWISPPEKLLAELDLFVCSSRTESFGLVVIEAMAAGAPVVATDIEGPRILLGEGRYGRLVPPEAPALAQAIAAALDDPKASLGMAGLAQAEAIAPYDMDAGGTRLWTALIPLLEGR